MPSCKRCWPMLLDMLDCAGRWHLPERYHYRPWVHRYVDSQNHPGQQAPNFPPRH
ncbi:unnamed protein product [Penicillium roqueforti FM164]|uniref:Genomic scaffold, ProqFM164S02 n=1 Tax=Penicillium roqueforti (strain FM164) TaxID=1365484 RepID=W6Q8T7_PENRF|nr:unnamed protein product [Penicillium roqueforti FM164]